MLSYRLCQTLPYTCPSSPRRKIHTGKKRLGDIVVFSSSRLEAAAAYLSLSFGGYREGHVQPRLSLPSNREPAFRVIKELQVVVCSAMCLVIARCHCTARYDTTTNNDLLLSALLSRISSGPVPRNFFVVF